MPGNALHPNPGAQVIERQHGMRFPAPEVGLELHNRVSALPTETCQGTAQQMFESFGQERATEELAGIAILVAPLTAMHLPEVGGKLGLEIPAGGDIGMRGDDLAPGLQTAGWPAFDRGDRRTARLPAGLFLEAYAQQLLLLCVDLLRLGG